MSPALKAAVLCTNWAKADQEIVYLSFLFRFRLDETILSLEVKVAVNVGLASKVPNHVWTFDLPGIPNLVGTYVILPAEPRYG